MRISEKCSVEATTACASGVSERQMRSSAPAAGKSPSRSGSGSTPSGTTACRPSFPLSPQSSVLSEHFDDHRLARAEAVEPRGPVRPVAALADGRLDQVEREDLLAVVALVERPPEDHLVDALQLAEREGVGQ